MNSRSMLLTGEQIRAARALARLDQAELAKQCGLSLETIKRLERIRGPIDATVRTLNAIERAFSLAGVGFEVDDSGKIGVYTLLKNAAGDAGLSGGPILAREVAPLAPPRPSPSEGREPVLQRLIYFSTAAPETAAGMQDFLGGVLKRSAVRNAALGVTGALLACDGRFLQALEGTKEAIQQVYGAISIDPRHNSLRILQWRSINSRLFGDWVLCCGIFPSDAEVFALEPGMAEGFRPEILSPAAALGLLSIVRDLQRQPPRDRCADPRECSLTDACLDRICVASTGKTVSLPPEGMLVQ